jgi:hypothetical protein
MPESELGAELATYALVFESLKCSLISAYLQSTLSLNLVNDRIYRYELSAI